MRTSVPAEGQAQAHAASRFYRAVWRWHFYAGLYVVPFLIMLSITGLMMLWFTTIAPEYGERIAISPGAQSLPVTAQAKAATAQWPNAAVGQYIAPYSAETPAIFRIDAADGARMVAVNPYTGEIVQDRPQAGTWNEFASHIHGELFWGKDGGPGDFLIEIAASLGILLIITGLYLWWPRASARAFLPDLSLKGRALWKSLHSTAGFWLAIFLLFFLLSGLAWTGVWGGKYVQAWSTFPAEKWDNVPLSDAAHASLNPPNRQQVPWTLEQTLMPQSGSAAGLPGLPEGVPVNLDSLTALAHALGFTGRFELALPADEKGVWTISRDSMSYDSANPTGDRTVHVDQYSGKILADVGYADYPLAGKAMAVGIALHEGQMGWWNIIANFLFCAGVLLLCATGIVMWWLRRPKGELAAPAYPRDFRMPFMAAIMAVILAIAFPLGGLAIAIFAVVDFLLPKRLKEAGFNSN